jgi:hypothetical protein
VRNYVDYINGHVVRPAAEFAVPCPVTQEVIRLVQERLLERVEGASVRNLRRHNQLSEGSSYEVIVSRYSCDSQDRILGSSSLSDYI